MYKNFSITVAFIGTVFIGWFLLAPDSTQPDDIANSSDATIVAAQSPPTPPGPTEYYVSDYFDADGEFHDRGPMGTQDKVGVVKSTLNAIPNRTSEFLFIGGQTAAREQLATDHGHIFAHPNHTWDVLIGDHEIVAGKSRVATYGWAGIDAVDPESIGVDVDIDFKVYEIWELGSTGSEPTLLDRSTTSFKGVMTHAEFPVQPVPASTYTGPLWGSGQPEQDPFDSPPQP